MERDMQEQIIATQFYPTLIIKFYYFHKKLSKDQKPYFNLMLIHVLLKFILFAGNSCRVSYLYGGYQEVCSMLYVVSFRTLSVKSFCIDYTNIELRQKRSVHSSRMRWSVCVLIRPIIEDTILGRNTPIMQSYVCYIWV